MKEKQQLYFIAIIPDANTCEKITAIKEDFVIRFQSKKALRVVPHITLKSPFRLQDSNKAFLLQWFAELPVTVKTFLQSVKGFGCFTSSRNPVIFIKPGINISLMQLQNDVMTNFRKVFPQFEPVSAEINYKPHMTVAYRDLSSTEFEKAWQEYEHKNFTASFAVTEFCLLQHIQKKWEVIARHTL